MEYLNAGSPPVLTEPSVICPLLIGRAAPLATVRLALDRAAVGNGSTVLVSGESGIGKSRLAREALAAGALAKLGFTSRTQLAVWAADQGLVSTQTASHTPPGRRHR